MFGHPAEAAELELSPAHRLTASSLRSQERHRPGIAARTGLGQTALPGDEVPPCTRSRGGYRPGTGLHTTRARCAACGGPAAALRGTPDPSRRR